MRCDSNRKLGLDTLVRRLTSFELENFDNYVLVFKTIEFAFEAKLSLKEKGKEKKEN